MRQNSYKRLRPFFGVLADYPVDALSIHQRLVQRFACHHQVDHLVGLVDPLLPRVTFTGTEDTAIVESGDKLVGGRIFSPNDSDARADSVGQIPAEKQRRQQQRQRNGDPDLSRQHVVLSDRD